MPWRAPARRFPVLAIRDFRLLLAERLLAPLSLGFSLVGVSFAVLASTGSATDLSYVLAAELAPTLVCAPVAGVAADRFRPQRVLVASNVAIAAGTGVFGLLMLAGRPALWAMILLGVLEGTGIGMFYPASQALLPRLVPGALLQQASSVSRLAMNSAKMAGAAAGGLLVAATGPGWALTLCGAGLTGTVPLMLAIRGGRGPERGPASPGLLTELREGWTEFRSHTWLWVGVLQFCVVLMGWYAGFQVLGPVLARLRLGGPAAWGAITAADALGLIAGGLISLRYAPRRPILFVVLTGAALSVLPLALGLALPLPLICLTACCLGAGLEVMMVQWTVALATRVPPDKLARVSSYDVLGSMAATPLGALVAGPLAAAIGVRPTEFAAAAVMAAVSAACLIPREIRAIRGDDPRPEPLISSGLGAAGRG